MSYGRSLRVAGAGIALAALGILPLAAQQDVEDSHVTIANPAALDLDEANKVYDEMRSRMSAGYGLSNMAFIANYQSWPRYNSAPYLSATHGKRFVNNYANRIGNNYGTLEEGEPHPVGTVLAKDSMTVTDDGRIFSGALFVMEKLTAGTSPDTADWRYVMVLPDGTIFGDTTGDLSEQVEYCHACHRIKAKQDYVFFVPKKYQINR